MSKFTKFAVLILVFILFLYVMLYFGVQNPGGGCSSFFGYSSKVNYKDYEKINLESCGESQTGEGIQEIEECLNEAMAQCSEKKAYVRIPGFEASTRYIITTQSDCTVKFTGGNCGITTEHCDTLPKIDYGYIDC